MRQVEVLQNDAVTSKCHLSKLKGRLESRLTFDSNLLSSRLLFKSINIKRHVTTVLLFVLYVDDTWPHALTEVSAQRLLGQEKARKTFGSDREQVTGAGKQLHSDKHHSNMVHGSNEVD